VLAQVRALCASGVARRFGAVFDSRLLGYTSTLCALDVPPGELDAVAARIVPHPGVTHCYLRGWPDELDRTMAGSPGTAPMPNLWFTLAVPAGEFDAACAAMRATVAPYRLLELPARRRFKIDVVFDPATRDRSEHIPVMSDASDASDTSDTSDFSEQDKTIIRRLQGSLPLDPAPFSVIAHELGIEESSLLECLRQWAARGILRRIALIVRHHEIGFKANGMCVWQVAADAAVAAGRALAAHPVVTHCYERAPCAGFVYTLFAMIHTGSWRDTQDLFVRVEHLAGLHDGRLLCSLREFKKTSPEYFRTS
jgi:DNA-binding Lrp family transcriptional regulator